VQEVAAGDLVAHNSLLLLVFFFVSAACMAEEMPETGRLLILV